jgi:hypothetical protein
MQLKFLLLISFIGITNAVFSQGANLFDARSLSLSGSNVTCSDSWSGIYNPAGLGLHSSLDISINYSNRFLLSELSTQTIVSTIPTILGNISPSFRYYGGNQYNECNLVFAFGKQLAKWLSAGINFGYYMQTIEATNKRASAIAGQIGVIAIPLKGLKVGINIINPTGSAYGRFKGEELASGLQAGISLSGEQSYCLAVQINYSEFEICNYSMGAEFFIAEYLSIRAGLKFPASLSFSFGLGMEFQRLSIDFGFEQHSILGLSSAITMNYKIK